MIPNSRVEAVRRWMLMFLQPDRFAVDRPGHGYTLGSLYLDSADLQLYRGTRTGLRNRFKLRIRSYDDDPASPLFFEIKRRIDRVIRKSRVTLSRTDSLDILSGRKPPSEVATGEDLFHLETFLRLKSDLAAAPVVRVRYHREAYESTAQDRLRLTLDRGLSCASTPDFRFSLTEGTWRPVPMSGTLLEVKFTDYYPQWVAGMIGQFELQKIPYSKYNLSVERASLAQPYVRCLAREA